MNVQQAGRGLSGVYHPSARQPANSFEPTLVRTAVVDSFKRLAPQALWRNPVMMIVWLGALLTAVLAIAERSGFDAAISVWLWFTVLFANFAEALAEGRGKAQAASLRGAKQDTLAFKLAAASRDAKRTPTRASELRKGDLVLIEAGQPIPGDRTIATPDPSTTHDKMKALTRWPVTVSYYDRDAKADSGEQTPVYAMSFELYEDGVSRALVLDYNDFVISGKMGKFDVKDSKPCK